MAFRHHYNHHYFCDEKKIIVIISNHQPDRMLRSIWVSEEVWDLVHSNVDLAHLVIIMVMMMMMMI